MNKEITVEDITEQANDYRRGMLFYEKNGIKTEIFFNSANVEDCNNVHEVRFEQINNDTQVVFNKEEIDSITKNEEAHEPVYHIVLRDGTKINVLYLGQTLRDYDISNIEGDLLPSDLACVIGNAKEVVIGIQGNNISINKRSYDDVTLEENEEGDWKLEFGEINVTLYEDSCNQIHCINDAPMVKQYIIRPSYMPFIEIYVGLLMKQ